MQEGRSAYTTADNPGVGWMTHELTSATNLRITRALTGTCDRRHGVVRHHDPEGRPRDPGLRPDDDGSRWHGDVHGKT